MKMKMKRQIFIGSVVYFLGLVVLLQGNASLAVVEDITVNESLFSKLVIKSHLSDGYWIDSLDIDNDNDMDLIGYGLTSGQITAYLNPGPENIQQPWKEHMIVDLTQPVGMDTADIDGDGLTDIVITYEYGPTMEEVNPEGGKIVWLRNPGKLSDKWQEYYIGRDTGMHRLMLGHFTQSKQLELMSFPVVSRPHAIHSTVPIALYNKPLYNKPEDLYNAKSWYKTLVNNRYFKVIHDPVVTKNPELSDHDVLLVASQEGISWIYYDKEGNWQVKNIVRGDYSPQDYANSKEFFFGSNTGGIGAYQEKPRTYIAAIEPFHGGNLAAYIRDKYGKWQRQVLGKFGEVDELGYGTSHHLLIYDFDRDGSDEFLAAFPKTPKGVIYGKLTDLSKQQFELQRVSNDSASRIVLEDFDKDGRMDFATIGYNVPGYYEDQNPQVLVFLSQIK